MSNRQFKVFKTGDITTVECALYHKKHVFNDVSEMIMYYI